ncbi:MAG TPA: hypothetical protein VF189_01865 [Patescibacteria group bacterium]
MGKVRAKTLGDENAELKEKEEAEKRRLAKIEAAKAEGRAKKEAEVRHAELDSASQEQKEIANQTINESTEDSEKKSSSGTSKYAEKVALKSKGAKKAARSAKYMAGAKLIERNKLYSVKEALDLVEKAHMAKFDETVELHINTLTTGINGHVTLPHGTGKATRVAIIAPSKDANAAEDLLKEIEAGKINFDILVATPDAMPKLARVARVLGPRGLMPNPKNGTITPNPEAVAKQYAGGQMNFKTEAKTPIIHLSVGKLSFGAQKLSENIDAALKAVKSANIKSAVVKSTMSPAVKLHFGK